MQLVDRTPRPCIRCKVTKVKPGGPTGMCSACRTADPVMAQTQRDNYAQMRKDMRDWLNDNFEPDPRFGPGIGGAIAMRPKKGKKVW